MLIFIFYTFKFHVVHSWSRFILCEQRANKIDNVNENRTTGVSEDENEYSEAASMEASTSSHRHEHHVRGANPAMYPAALKLALRNHIRTLCATSHCVDSLVIYLSSATRSDGSSLLWDADHNGEVMFGTFLFFQQCSLGYICSYPYTIE